MGRSKKSASKPSPGASIRDRVVDFRRVPVADLRRNPKNWRTHPEKQRAAFRGLVAQVGFAGAELVYRSESAGGALTLIDGEMRLDEMPAGFEIPCLITDLDDAEADLLLATFDPISAAAEADTSLLNGLLSQVSATDAGLQGLLDELRSAPVLEFSDPPKSVEENVSDIEKIKGARRAANEGTESKNDTEKYLVIVFESRQAKEQSLKELGLPTDERYIPAASITVKPRGLVKPAVADGGRPIKAAAPENSGAGG